MTAAGARGIGARVARVEDLCTLLLQLQHSIERQRFQIAFQRLVERGALFAVQHGIVDEIWGSLGLISGHQFDECFLAHGLQGVIQPPLISDG